MTKIRIFPSFLLLVVFSGFFLASCSSDDPVETNNVDPIPDGITALENELYSMINSGDINSPSDMDFTAAKTHFQNAVRQDPTNPQGHFGFSLTSLLALSSDSEINAAFDEWEAYLENHTPFEGSGKALSPLGIPLTFASGNQGMELPLEILAQSLFVGMQPKMDVVEPSIARVQNIFRNRVIPALEESATHLAMVAEDPDFVFWVTPRMQGDPDEDPLELDLTEVQAARAGVLLLTSVCRLAVAYDLSFPSFDAAGIVGGLDYDTGTMLRLGTGGGTHMNQAEMDFLASVDAIDAGIDFLLNESDPQDNDIIKTGPDDFSRGELEEFQINELQEFRDVFGEDGLVLTEDWDNDFLTPAVPLEINAHNFFTNPIPDWKRVLPPYVVTTREVSNSEYDPQDYIYWYDYIQSPTAGYAEGGCVFFIENSQAVRDSLWGNSILSNRAREIGQWEIDYLTYYQYRYDGTLSVSGEKELVVGSNEIDWIMDFELTSDAPTTVIPHLTWEAENFEDWKSGWGNHNFNGLLPEIQTNDQLFNLFGITADGWEREFDIDWTNLD